MSFIAGLTATKPEAVFAAGACGCIPYSLDLCIKPSIDLTVFVNAPSFGVPTFPTLALPEHPFHPPFTGLASQVVMFANNILCAQKYIHHWAFTGIATGKYRKGFGFHLAPG